ncbi:MAG TPA: pantothenate kinase, partial [Allocoleopsis sp.]
MDKKESLWLGLMIGNSRLHFALFENNKIKQAWDINHLSQGEIYQDCLSSLVPNFNQIPLYLASVVPDQTVFWDKYPHLQIITLANIPIKGMYSTLGIDRALALFGGGECFGYPVLIIDAGTALTFTGVDEEKQFQGGAIIPGLRLQIQSLAQRTAILPEVNINPKLSGRFAQDTESAIQSGIIYTLLAGIVDFIQHWRLEFPKSKIVLTGGDRRVIFNYLKLIYSPLAGQIIVDKDLI